MANSADWIDLFIKVTDFAIAGAAAIERWQQVQQNLATMKAEGRDPTPGEMAALFAQIEADTAAIQAASDNLAP